MWKHVKWAMFESTWEVCSSVRMAGKEPKYMWWHDEIKAAVQKERKGCLEGGIGSYR